MFEPKVVYCPECGEVLYINTLKGYMVGNIILKGIIIGACSCGHEFFSNHNVPENLLNGR